MLHDTRLWRALARRETACYLPKILMYNIRGNHSRIQGFSETKLSTHKQKFKARQLNRKSFEKMRHTNLYSRQLPDRHVNKIALIPIRQPINNSTKQTY